MCINVLFTAPRSLIGDPLNLKQVEPVSTVMDHPWVSLFLTNATVVCTMSELGSSSYVNDSITAAGTDLYCPLAH